MTVNFGADAPAIPATAAAQLATPANPKWKAVGFLNIEIPADTKTGMAKFGAVPLTMEDHSDVLEFLLEDPAKTQRRAQQLATTFVVNYRSATKVAKGFKLVDLVDEADAAKAAKPEEGKKAA